MSHLSGLLLFWFNTMKRHWFGCPHEIDKLVFDTWNRELDLEYGETDDIKINLSKIILYDQVSRHILRYTNSQDRQSYYDNKAMHIFETSGILDKLEELKEEERCFALMPLRHTFIEHNLEYCLELVTKWMEISSCQIYDRFYQATVKALAQINNKKDLFYNSRKSDIQLYCSILDKSSPFNFDIKIHTSSNHLVDEFKSNCIPKNNKLIISVSGGVDSMVCLILSTICYPKAEIKAISINYANREEQMIEIDMVNYICRQLNVKHYVRTISEIKRVRDSNRDFYESITREIRFSCYKNIMDEDADIPIILGHNQDDTLENVFSNIKKRINYENLFGMEHKSLKKGVTIMRPLLEVPKEDIIAFAKEYNIPYTYDSTPSWCERGRLRDILMPTIRSFDKNLMPGIIEMVNNYKQIYKVYENSLPKIVLIDNDNNNIKPYYEIQCEKPVFILDYWKRIFTTIATNYKVSFVSNKSIQHFISQIKIHNSENKKCIILSYNLYAVIPRLNGYISIHLTDN